MPTNGVDETRVFAMRDFEWVPDSLSGSWRELRGGRGGREEMRRYCFSDYPYFLRVAEDFGASNYKRPLFRPMGSLHVTLRVVCFVILSY